jgi:hypothetical protein
MINNNWTITTFRVIYYMYNEELGPFIIKHPNYQKCLEFNDLIKFNNHNIKKLIPNIIIYSNEYTIYDYELILEIKCKWFIEPDIDINYDISNILHNYFNNSIENKNLNFQNKKLFIHNKYYIDSFGKNI